MRTELDTGFRTLDGSSLITHPGSLVIQYALYPWIDQQIWLLLRIVVGLVEKNSIRAAIVLFETTADIVEDGAKSMYPNISCKNLSVGAFDNVPVVWATNKIRLIDAKSDPSPLKDLQKVFSLSWRE